LQVGVVLVDLAAGFRAVEAIAQRHGFVLRVRVFEAFGDGDPLPFLRPSSPPLEG
jgi:hypothetical protein